MFKRLFWNSQENRLHAGWRLLTLFLFHSAAFLLPFYVIRGFRSPALSSFAPRVLALPLIVAVVWLATRYLDHRPFADLGLHLNMRWWVNFGFGLFLGASLMTIIFLGEWGAGWTSVRGTFGAAVSSFPLAIAGQLLMYICIGFFEELIFRGYFIRNMAEGFRVPAIGARGAVVWAWVLSSAFFALTHALNPKASVISTINIAFIGLLFGLGYLLTASLALPIGLHITWNFFQGNVFGFPVSGGRSWASFITTTSQGPELWTGGSFGPEAGLTGFFAVLTGILLILLWTRIRYGKIALQNQISQP